MTYKQYYNLIREAMEAESLEMFIGDLGYPDWLHDLYGGDAEKTASALENVYTVANMSVADMRRLSGLSQVRFAERFGIPRRTIENWEMSGDNKRDCPEYVRLMIADLLGLVEIEREQ